ncbi:glycosyltransferase family 2 protein [Photobacterium iliopiscarium]|uniref:glycosyltransferase family 2 protein n=1 Tax=Photobacterium iliopiscarium TaxID=56192 RepID=UPI001E4DF100|nr:glycosyltransferase family 2 protein [Photobacterium iliopiscarium]MCD9486614.1 glycosyltransferase [Photobacterium iliopiscarium]MCF2243223.1 glycosyltransferase [Photobacterium iliopiscarium]
MIDIVLATYNGELYIKEQIDSILNCDKFDELINTIIISDDNSKDSTKDIIYSYNHPKIKFVTNKSPGGVISNFSNGISFTKSQYVIFSDQDDVWKKDKLTILFDGIKKLDIDNKPSLFFTDLNVVDENLNVLADSFWQSQGINPFGYEKIETLLFQNVSPGCVMICNRQLLEIAYPFPNNIMMHDWWLLLIARIVGNVAFSNEKTILYRQHGNNVVGAKGMGIMTKITRLITNKAETFVKTIEQVKELEKRLGEHFITNDAVSSLSKMDQVSIIKRMKIAKSFKLQGQNYQRTVLLYIRLLYLRKNK